MLVLVLDKLFETYGGHTFNDLDQDVGNMSVPERFDCAREMSLICVSSSMYELMGQRELTREDIITEEENQEPAHSSRDRWGKTRAKRALRMSYERKKEKCLGEENVLAEDKTRQCVKKRMNEYL